VSYVDAGRSLIRRSSLLYDCVEPPYSRAVIARWKRQGAVVPAPGAYKRDVLRRVAREHRLRILVETGTYTGDTVLALSRDFERVVSVELSPQLHAVAVRNTAGRRNVELLLGDSAEVLPGVLAGLEQPALFWLDAHYSEGVTARGETVSPIATELELVLGDATKGHVVLIDDAREFHDSARSGYPPVEVVAAAARRHGYTMSESEDIFFLLPPERTI
jgi:hypothetical protein